MISSIEGKERYEIVRLIAEGGMGAVYEAKKIGVAGFEKRVAIKVMLDKLSGDREQVERFIDEAKLVANLIHENIVQIYQLDRCAEGYYFVLEYVDGISLFDLMDFHAKIGRTLPLNLAVFIAGRIARGLAYAHSRRDTAGNLLGIVHCDVCPHNILINTEGVPKLTDFGVARMNRVVSERVSGKLAYMAPEQARLEKLDFRADIYALGMVLFYLLSGQQARDLTRDPGELLLDARNNRIGWEKLPALPLDLDAILRRMLSTAPADRFDDTAELARELEYFIYKDGYGPTIVTLADYIRELMPGRWCAAEQTIDDCDKTVVIPK
ncbi:MAG: serine/threonine-protein kinase [Victivallaceae bacterium]|nr:serine/threonine-protein kinase [Victivallaceae bacterium]